MALPFSQKPQVTEQLEGFIRNMALSAEPSSISTCPTSLSITIPGSKRGGPDNGEEGPEAKKIKLDQEMERLEDVLQLLAGKDCPMTERKDLKRLAKAFDMLELTCRRGRRECERQVEEKDAQ